MRRRLIATGLAALVAAATLTACFPLPLPGPKPSASQSEDQPADELNEFGYTDDQQVLLDQMFLLTIGQDVADANELLGDDQVKSVADQYLQGAETICSLDPAVRTSDATHKGFVDSFVSSSGMTDDIGEGVWDAIIAYCETQD